MRAVVIGASGQIGGWLMHVLRQNGHEAIGTYFSVPVEGLAQLDVGDTDHATSWLRSQRPNVVFYPAGFTWVDGCERDPDRAFAANRDQPLALARAAADLGARFVYFSSDYVFDGADGPNDEADTPNPINVYGQSKLAAEEALRTELGEAQLTIRTSWVFGPERQGKNFAYQVARALSEGKTLSCPNDMLSSPSYGPDVAWVAVRLAETGRAGLIHVAGPETLPRSLFARAIAAAFRLDPRGIIEKPDRELPQVAARPHQGGLKTTRLLQVEPGRMRSLPVCLRDFPRRLAAHSWCKAALPR